MTENTTLKRTARAIFLYFSEMRDISENELSGLNSAPSIAYARFPQKIHSLESAPIADSRRWSPSASGDAQFTATENTGLKRTAQAIFLYFSEMSGISGNELSRVSYFLSVAYIRFLQKIHSLETAPIPESRTSPS